MRRREFSAATRRQAWERSEGLCEAMRDGVRCLQPLTQGRFHYDHRDPDWISGRHDLDNCQVICLTCHKGKTRQDVKTIAKIKRIKNKAIKAKTSRQPLPGGRNTPWKKTFSYGWVRREDDY